MFSDPQTVTVNAVAKVMPRIENTGRKSIYQLSDQTFTLTLSHTAQKDRVRSMARIDQRALVPDPITSVNDWEILTFYVVIDRPLAGFSAAQVDQLRAGLSAWLNTATTDKLYGQES